MRARSRGVDPATLLGIVASALGDVATYAEGLTLDRRLEIEN